MPKKSTRKLASKPHDLAVLVKLGRVTAPKQIRTEKRLQEIVQAMESLLDGRSFEEITIPDIAKRSGCGTASIYARFHDKRSILVALHESIRDRQIAEIDEVSSFERCKGMSFEQTALSICRSIVDYYSKHRNLLRPAYLLNDAEIYERHAGVMRYASEKIAALLLHKMQVRPATKARIDKQIDLATKVIFALLQQRMVFDRLSPARYPPKNDSELAAQLASLVRLCVATDLE